MTGAASDRYFVEVDSGALTEFVEVKAALDWSGGCPLCGGKLRWRRRYVECRRCTASCLKADLHRVIGTSATLSVCPSAAAPSRS